MYEVHENTFEQRLYTEHQVSFTTNTPSDPAEVQVITSNNIHTHTHTHIHTYKHTHIHTYIHTHTHTHKAIKLTIMTKITIKYNKDVKRILHTVTNMR